MLNLTILRKVLQDIKPASLCRRHFSFHANISTPKRLEGKVAMITGGASGIGEATARVFTKEGAKVVIADIQDEGGQKVKEKLGSCVDYIHCDVSEEAHVSAAVDFAIAKHGALDIMFNNAGVCDGVGPVASLDMQEFNKVMGINVGGVVSGVKHAARVMIPARKGCILCTGSINGVMAIGLNHPYTIAKHAVMGIVKSAASELGRYGIRVNAISPYMIPTPMLLHFFQKLNHNITTEILTQKLCQPNSTMEGVTLSEEDIALAALFLASEDGRFVNGHNLVVDGGFTVSKDLNLIDMNKL